MIFKCSINALCHCICLLLHDVHLSHLDKYYLLCDDETGEDVSENKDEGVIRRQLVKGEGYVTPKEGASCEGIVRFFIVF